jgi:hypothetical protein
VKLTGSSSAAFAAEQTSSAASNAASHLILYIVQMVTRRWQLRVAKPWLRVVGKFPEKC